MTKPKGKARANDSRRKRLKSKNDFFIRRKKILASIRKWDDEILTKECEEVEEWDEEEDDWYEDDGQPDEAQEWYDFDPDC